MADPLLGTTPGADIDEVLNYLGVPVPVSLKGQPALPVGGAPAGAAVGPTGRAAAGTRALTPGSPGEGAGTAGAGGSDALRLVQQGLKLADVAGSLLGGPKTVPTSALLEDAGGAPAFGPARGSAPAPGGPPITVPTSEILAGTAGTEAAAGLSGAEAALATEAEQGAVAAGTAGTEAAGALSGLGDVLPYLKAAYSIASRAAAGDDPAGEQAAKAAIEVAAAAAAPFTFGLSMFAPMVLEVVGQETPFFVDPLAHLLYGTGEYGPKRQTASKTARGGLTSLASSYQAAAQTGDAAKVLDALSRGEVDERIRSELWLPADVAKALNLSSFAASGDRARIAWNQVSPEQFTQVLDYFEANPEALGASIVGSGDVPYLPQTQAQQVADQAATGARTMIDYMIQLRRARQAFSEAEQAGAPAAAPMLAEAAAAPAAVTPGGGGAALGAELLKEEPVIG